MTFEELFAKGWRNLTKKERDIYRELNPKNKKPVDDKKDVVYNKDTNINTMATVTAVKGTYKDLPPPVVAHLERTFGSWLNTFKIWQEYKEDFGGYGIFIEVPQQFSTEWKKEKITLYDNATRKVKEEKDILVPDIRCKSLKDTSEAIKWIDLVKEHIITHAYTKGIQLPSTNSPLDETKKTLDDYRAALHV